MIYNGDGTKQDCVSEILQICGGSLTNYSINDVTRRFNAALDDYFDIAFDSDSSWSFDDINQTSAAPVTQNLVSGTNAYKVSAFTGSPISISGVNIFDDNGTVAKLTVEEFVEASFEIDYATTTTGQPTHYTKRGNFIYLRPTPNYNESNGLRAFVDRVPLYMTTTDTLKEPGVPRMHHLYLCRKTALPYLLEHNLVNAGATAQLIQIDENNIRRYYSRRAKDMPQRMTAFNNDTR